MNKNNIITVKNAEGDPDTQAEIIIQNKIDYIPKVSVIIPVYNVEEYLRECLDSVVNQTLKEIEIICVDDGSTDNSLEILKEYTAKDKRMTVIKQENKGAGTARNIGLKTAKGDFLSFLDADDFFEANMLEVAFIRIQETEADFIIYNSNQFNDKTKQFINPEWFIKYNYFPNKEVFNCSEISCNIFKSIVGWAWDKLYRASFVKKHNLYFQEQRTTNDALFVFSALFLAEKVSLLDKEKRFVHHRVNNLSSLENTRSKSWTCFYVFLVALRDKIISTNKLLSLEHDFINYALTFSLWNLRTLKEPIHSFLKEKLKNEWFKSLGITSKTEDYFEVKDEYKQLLAILNDNNEPIKIAIHGSCCSREIFNSPLNTFNLGVYLFQNSIHTMFEEPYFNIKENDVPSNSNFLRRMVASEFNKKALHTLINNKADYLMIDVGDLRLGQFNINFKDGKKTKILKTNDTEKQLLQLKSKLKNFDFTIEPSNNISEKEWDFLINQYVTELKKIYPVNKIILNKLAIASQYEEDGRLVEFTKKIGGETFLSQNLLLKLENKLEKKLKGCLILDNPPFPIIADPNHKLGLHLLHLKQDIYDWKMEKLQELVTIKPKVSVIMPCYNTALYLRQALDSVVNQTLKDIEIICVNDGSTDNTLDIIKEYAAKDNRIVIIDGSNGGYGKAMNKGLDRATGEYIGILEPDDYLKLDMYETQYNKAKELDLDIIKADYYQFEGEKNQERYKYTSVFVGADKTYYNRLLNPATDTKILYAFSTTWAGIYRRSFIEKFNIRHNETPGASYQDNGFWAQTMYLAKRIYFLNSPFYYYRQDNSNQSMKKRNNVWTIPIEYEFIDKVFDKHIELKPFKAIYVYRKFCAYLYHMHQRLDEEYWTEYLERMSKEFKLHISKKEFDDKYYSKKQLADFNLIINSNFQKYIEQNKQNKTLISVIIPVYNTEKYLHECLDSVINQTLKDIEIICVDDGSTDSSLKILKEYAGKDKRITILTQSNLKQGAARNKALKHANGNYILFIDSDDYIRKDTCEILYSHANTKQLDLVLFSGYNVNWDTKELQENNYWSFTYCPAKLDKSKFTFENCNQFIHKLPVSACLTMYNRQFLVDKKILFPEQLYFEDNLFFIKAITQMKFAGICDEKLYFRTIHASSTTQNWEKNFSDYLKIVDMVLSYLRNRNIGKDILKNYIDSYMNTIKWQYDKYSIDVQKKYQKEINFLVDKYINNKTTTQSPLLFKDIGFGCNTWCKPKNVTGDDIKNYTYDLSDNIYTRYVSWDPIKEGSCDVEIKRLYAVEKRTKKIVEFPINKIISSGKILGNKVEFRNKKGCWIGCTIEGAYESFTIEAKINNL